VRVAVLASGEGSNLQALLDRAPESDDFEIVAVAGDSPGCRALERACAAGVACADFPLTAFATRVERDLALADWLQERDVELVVLAGYMALLSDAFLARFPLRVINVHPALLPAFPGLRAVEQAIAYGVKLTGVTVHFVDGGVDTGPIILQHAVELPAGCTVEQAVALLRPVEHRLLPEAVRLLARGAVRVDRNDPRLVHVER
jgi:phosphoribosylglycinamide formyltransferase-1